MILIGMFDSPFVRRVAVSMDVLGMPFEHRDWSTGRDADRIRAYNPLGRVPTLVLDDEAVLFESSAVLDHLDQTVGAERALLPAAGAERRQALQLIALATGVADKAVTMVYERVFRPEDKRHGPWLARCQTQVEHALAALETHCTARAGHDWLIGERMTQADITRPAAAASQPRRCRSICLRIRPCRRAWPATRRCRCSRSSTWPSTHRRDVH